MADAPPGVRFTFLDYVALGFILPGAEEFLRRGKEGWPIWAPGFALGVITLAFRDKSPRLVAWFVDWFRAPKKLAAAIAENADLKKRIEELDTSLASSPSAPKSRLKIISAYFGVDGGPDREVGEEFLQPRIQGDALAGWVGSDLFGPLDPAIGQHKRLKVRYSFDGREATIVRPENALLILPEDRFLGEQVDDLQRELQQVKSEIPSIAVNGKLIAGPLAFEEQRKAVAAQLVLSFELISLVYRPEHGAWDEAGQFDHDAKTAMVAWFTNPVPPQGVSGVEASRLSAHIKYSADDHWRMQVSRGYWLHHAANGITIITGDRAGLILGLVDWSHWVSYENPYTRTMGEEMFGPVVRPHGDKRQMPQEDMVIEVSLLGHGTTTLDTRKFALTFTNGKPFAVV